MIKKTINGVAVAFLGAIILTGCAMQPTFPQPTELVEPQAIMDNSGEIMCPYTQDGVLAEWTDKAINVGAAAGVGGAVGAYAGQKALEFIPFVGGFLGQKLGDEAARAIALESIGGEEFLKESSDLSFNTVEELSVYMYINFSTNEHYADALESTMDIYPDMKQGYYAALQSAERCPIGGCIKAATEDTMETQNIGSSEQVQMKSTLE